MKSFQHNKLFAAIILIIIAAFCQQIYADDSTFGPTTDNDHLWRIAIQVRPNDSVSAQQMMIAILGKNPGAFKKGNVNGLITGKMLALPDITEINKISTDEAKKIIDEQNNAWLVKNNNHENKIKKPNQHTNSHALKIVKTKRAHAERSQVENTKHYLIIQNQIDELRHEIKSINNTEQAAAEKIVNLSNMNNALQNQIYAVKTDLVATTQSITELKFKVTAMQKTIDQSLLNKLIKYWNNSKDNLLIPTIIWALAAITAISMLIVKLFSRKRNKSLNVSSNEEIAAKLDLARMYIAMNDKNNAEQVLKEIIERGDASQKSAANELLKNLEHL